MSISTLHYDPVSKIIHGGQKSISDLDPRGIGYHLFDSMRKWSQLKRVAQIDSLTGLEDTFEKLLSRCIRIAIFMQKLGIKKGDIISICSNNHLNAVVPLIAAYFIGAITAPTDPVLSIEDTRYLLEMVKPKLIFTSGECEKLIENAMLNTDFNCMVISFEEESKLRTFNSFLEKKDGENEFVPVHCEDPTETALILFSSGTTGMPKGICLNHLFIISSANGINSCKYGRTTFMSLASLYWISTIIIITASLMHGNQRVLCPSFEPETIWDVIDKHKVSFLFIAPVQAIKIIPYISKKGKSLKYMMIAGGAISPNYLTSLRNHLPQAIIGNSYGQTEIGCISVFKEKSTNYEKLKSCGQPIPGLKIRIVDTNTEQVLPLNYEGEIRIKPTYPINGYYKRDSSDVWDTEGYMKTGDVGCFDEDLCLFVTDRVKEMFKYMAYHIVPSKLETILQSHPAVELAVVIGVPHPIEGNHALGIVTLLPDGSVSSKELEQYVEERVDERNRLRAGVRIVPQDSLPMTPTGKIKRRELREVMTKQSIKD